MDGGLVIMFITTGVVVDKFDRLSAFNTAALVLCFGMNGGFLRP